MPTIFEGGMLPPVTVSGGRSYDTNYPQGFGLYNGYDDGSYYYDDSNGGGGVGSDGGGSASSTAAATNAVMGPLPPASPLYQLVYGDPLLDKIAAERIADINKGRALRNLPPLTEKTANERFTGPDGKQITLAEGITLDVEKGLQAELGLQDAAKTQAARSAAVAAKASGNSGIPLILPIPGLDPMTGLAITAAGLIFSGGKVARLDPSNPIGSVVNAAQGTVGTVQNAADVVTGKQDIRDIWGVGTGTGTGTPTGSSGTATGSGATGSEIDPSTNAAGVGIFGTGSIGSTSNNPPVSSTSLSSSSTPVSTTNAPVSVTPGALGGVPGQTTPAGGAPAVVGAGSTQTGTTASTTNAGDNKALDQMNIWLGGVGKTTPTNTNTNTGTTVSSGATGTGTGGDTNTGSSASTAVTSVNPWDAIEKMKRDAAKAAQDKIDAEVAAVGVIATNKTNPDGPSTKTSTPVGGTTPNDGPSTKTSTPVGGTTPSGATATVITSTPTFTFTNTANSGLAQRDFAKEFGLTAATLTGKPGDDLAAYYKQLQQQFTPSSLTTLGTTAETQLAADLARYNQAQSGNLSAEDTRSAQQSAREAYGARGQVMGRGAIGAEILNRDSLQRQRESEARASVQQSIGNLRNAADLQTGNIFSPFAKLISENYSPQSPYAREVYDYNVNAYNAYQAAQQNLAAYKEAASKGQEAQFVNSFVGFLANNGIKTTVGAVQSIIDGLIKPGASTPTK